MIECDYQICDDACPKCGNSITHYRECEHCDGGLIDAWEEDAINFSPGDSYSCSACKGDGRQTWCPKCGEDIYLEDNNGA